MKSTFAVLALLSGPIVHAADEPKVTWFAKGDTSFVIGLAGATGQENPPPKRCTVAMVNAPQPPFCPWCRQQVEGCTASTQAPIKFSSNESAKGTTHSPPQFDATMLSTTRHTAVFGDRSMHVDAHVKTDFQNRGQRQSLNDGLARASGQVRFNIPPGRSMFFEFKGTLHWTDGPISNRGMFGISGVPNTGADLSVYITSAPLYGDKAGSPPALLKTGIMTPGDYTIGWHAENNVRARSGSVDLSLDLNLTPWTCKGDTKTDTDEDGLPDEWEIEGVRLPNGKCVPAQYVFDADGDGQLSPGERPDPLRKDVYVEVDWLPGQQYTISAFAPVIEAFKRAPVPNPDAKDPRGHPKSGAPGITLHVYVDEEARDFKSSKICLAKAKNSWKPFGNCPDVALSSVRAAYFMPKPYRDATFTANRNAHYKPTAEEIRLARQRVFRYALLAEEIDDESMLGGLAPVGGNDLVVAPGSYRRLLEVFDQGSGLKNNLFTCPIYAKVSFAFMHELGHTLGLHHGGGDDINNKPNYLSVMNYLYMFQFCNDMSRLDYSRIQLRNLDTGSLFEQVGLGGPSFAELKKELQGRRTVFGPAVPLPLFRHQTGVVQLMPPAPAWNSNCSSRYVAVDRETPLLPVANADGPVDWNQNCQIDEQPVEAEINRIGPHVNRLDIDPVLHGWNDWANLDFNFRDSDYYTATVATP